MSIKLFRAGQPMWLYLLSAMATAFCFTAAASASETCTREQAIKAETEASTLATWSAVFESYVHYKYCDTGAIREGYSNSVATLLAAHWDQFAHLRKLTREHPQFLRFVLHHVDEAMTSNQAHVIRENVQSTCPVSGQSLCEAITKRIPSPSSQ